MTMSNNLPQSMRECADRDEVKSGGSGRPSAFYVYARFFFLLSIAIIHWICYNDRVLRVRKKHRHARSAGVWKGCYL